MFVHFTPLILSTNQIKHRCAAAGLEKPSGSLGNIFLEETRKKKIHSGVFYLEAHSVQGLSGLQAQHTH